MTDAQRYRLTGEGDYFHDGIDPGTMIEDDNGDYYKCEDVDDAIASLRRELDEAKAKVADREAELLRVRTHETAAAHELDCKLSPEERHTFKTLVDENARLRQQRVENPV